MVNKRTSCFFIIYICTFISVFSQEIFQFKTHFSYFKNISQLALGNSQVYAVTDGKLFIYKHDDESVDTYIKSDGGNSNISQIAFNNKNKCLVLSREDANIELVFEDKSYTNIFDLKNFSQNIDKTINNILCVDDYAYMATNFGYLILDVKNGLVKESGIFNIPFYNIIQAEDKLYATTKNGVLTANISDNLKDLANWKKLEISKYYAGLNYQFTDDEITQVLEFNSNLFFLVPNKAVYTMDSPTEVKAFLAGNKPLSISKSDTNRLYIIDADYWWNYSSLTESKKVAIDNLGYVLPKNEATGEYWVSGSTNNLSLIKVTELGYDYVKRRIKPEGPATNTVFSLNYQNNQLMLTAGGFYNDRFRNPADWSILRKQKWIHIYQDVISEASGVLAQDFVYAISDPKDANHTYVSSWGEGLYEFQDGVFKNRYDHTNSTIEEIVLADGFRTTRVSGMDFDKNGNLWLVNSMVSNIIKVFTKNGEWKQIYYPEIDKLTTSPKNILIDQYNNKWITTIQGNPYIMVFNENNTIDDASDDKKILINTFSDQYGNGINISNINHIAQDVNGSIWLSTDAGPFMIYNSSTIFTKPSPILYKIMIEKDAVNNTLGALLEKVPINAIAVDGANRKWIATQYAGVYLLSADNKEIISQFTLDNSVLPSNNVTSLAIDPETGIVFMGTDKGLISYRSEATKGASDFSNVVVYPNPVRPDYSGSITISGLKSDSRVKITDIKGNLLAEGNSFGGQYIWDGRNGRGTKVATGVYLVFGSADNGQEGMVTKIMVVN